MMTYRSWTLVSMFALGCGAPLEDAAERAGPEPEVASLSQGLSRAELRLQLSFSERSGDAVLDSSGLGHNGRLYGAARLQDPAHGPVLDFDGVNDYVNVPERPALNITGSMTMAAWVRTRDPIAGPKPQQREILFRGQANIVFGFEKDRLVGDIYLRCYLRHSLDPLVYREVAIRDNDAKVRDGNWHHVAVVYRPAGTMSLYLDGAEVARREHEMPSLMLSEVTNHYSIGGRLRADGGVDRNLDGQIDDVRIYARELSNSEVRSLYGIRAAR